MEILKKCSKRVLKFKKDLLIILKKTEEPVKSNNSSFVWKSLASRKEIAFVLYIFDTISSRLITQHNLI